VVCGVGSGGTITGLGRFFARVSPATEMVLADPEGSVLAGYVATGKLNQDVGSWLVEGIGEDFIPPVCDLGLVRRAYTIPDAEAFATLRALLAREGILAGSSTGTLLAAALRYCCEATEPKRVVTFVCDSGNKYLSRMFNDFWMIDQGFIDLPRRGDFSDLIARRHAERATITVGPDETLTAALGRMKLADVSQLPVISAEDRIVGLIDESDILLRVIDDEARFADPVRSAMTTQLETVPPDAEVHALMPIFAHGRVAIVMDGDRFLGLITRIDLLNYLRRRMR
jgi:cystathionine beta-synthase